MSASPNPELAAAAAEAEVLLAQGRGDAHDWMTAALGRAARGDDEGARQGLKRALALEPSNPAILTGQAIILHQQGRLRDAVLACDAAIRAAPDYADAWLERGSILAAGGSPAARDSFARAAALAPGSAAAQAGLAAIAARNGEAEEARIRARRALALDPANVLAGCALASVELESGNFEAARALLEPLVARQGNVSADRSLALGLLGDAYHQLERFEQAYDAYARSKADFAAINADAMAGRLSNREFIQAIAAGLDQLRDAAWNEAPGRQPDSAAPRHVFLLGYPRSGTTLLENVLASLRGVAALEERPTLATADRTYLSGNSSEIAEGLATFARLDAAGLEALRQAYWDKVRESGIPVGTHCFVDMDPLKGTRLALIARLFPDARILLMRRDPRDVVWSCFRTKFAPSSGTFDFTSLERAAEHYDALMRLTEQALDLLPLNVHVVHYHSLVQEFDTTTQEICAFIGLDWSEDMRRFDRTALRRGVSTASAGQVRRGLYDGTRQWERYARFLEPVMPILAPWIERFGYAA